MKRRKLKILIDKYLDKKVNAVDVYILERWYDSFDNDSTESKAFKDPDTLNRIKNDIVSITVEKDSIKRNHLYQRSIAWAACFTLAIGLGIVFYQNINARHTIQPEITFHIIKTSFGETKEVTLIDGTVIILNANSEISIQNDFNKGNRKVMLNGEAFFQVVRDTLSPFLVKTPSLNVKVLGTSFNLKSRKEVNRETLQVYTGKVQITNEAKILAVLERKQQLVYDKGLKSAVVSKSVENQDVDWKTGQAVLYDVSFQELNNEFYNIYGTRLMSQKSDVLSKKYSLTLRSARTMEESLEVLCKIINKKYRKEGESIIIY